METTAAMDSGAAAAGGILAALGMGFFLVMLAIFVLMIICMWIIFSKAGQPGWASIIPIYNLYVMCKIAGKPGWWLLLLFIPLVGIVIGIILVIAIAQNFGKGAGFGIGMLFLPVIFYPILAFGSAQYCGEAR